MTLAAEGDPLENLVRALKTKHMLLVFDNCEHLVEPAARVVAAILSALSADYVPGSGRQGLGIAGEATYRMPSLDVPERRGGPLASGRCVQFAAVALFVERARAADKRFALTDENAPIVADICRRLDGIPLAIELAASRVKILSPRQLRERLDERFRVLTGGSRDVLPRQQTLRALIDWSYDLLDERERALFRRLGIFVNGFTLEEPLPSAAARTSTNSTFSTCSRRWSTSRWCSRRPDGDALRYRLLESTRAYALEKLADAGERERSRAALAYLRDRFVELWEHWDRTGRRGDLTRALVTELDDVRTALDGALHARRRSSPGVRCLPQRHRRS